MIKVVSFTICPFVQRITALLAAKNIPYEIEYISLSNKPQWFLDISPNGQVPVLITENNTALFESDAIAEYLDDVFPVLTPTATPERKALDRAWVYQATKHYLVQCGTMRSSNAARYHEKLSKLAQAFAKAEKALSEQDETVNFWHGSELSNVDLAWLPLLHRADIIARHSGIDMLADFPAVKTWQKALLAMNTENGENLVQASVSVDFEQKFSDFYLSQQSYLGQKKAEKQGECCAVQTTENTVEQCATSCC